MGCSMSVVAGGDLLYSVKRGEFIGKGVKQPPRQQRRVRFCTCIPEETAVAGRYTALHVHDAIDSGGPTRDLWYNKLHQLIAAERESQPKSDTIQVIYRDPVSNTEYCQSVPVTPLTTAADCVSSLLTSLQLPDVSTSGEAAELQLWVRSAAAAEQVAVPLLGPELPMAIQANAAREAADEPPDLDHCNNVYCSAPPAPPCQFLLRPVGADVRPHSPSPDSVKKKKTLKKSPIRIHKVFRRTNSKADSVDSAVGLPPGALFGQPLTRVCPPGALPSPVMAMLAQLFRKGPYTVGIFRKSANARVVKEIKEKLDSNIEVDMETVNIYAVAGLAKDFLRSLPDPLLGSELYEEWRDVADLEDEHDRIQRIRELCARLQPANVSLLRHFLCVLHFVSRRSHHNLMSAANIAVCVGPSLLAPASPVQALTSDGAKRLPSVVALMVEKCDVIFGSKVLRLFGGRTARADSGEESDVPPNGGSVRRDDSSIDSLERELLDENEPLPRKDKMAATNLSRDSGLTLSDSQLYALDDEESASTSSGQSAHKSDHSGCSSGRGSDNSFQPRSTDGGGVYATVAAPRGCRPGAAVRQGSPSESVYSRPPLRHAESAFQRQDWTRQHHPLRRSGKATLERMSPMRRSASEESLTARCEQRPAATRPSHTSSAAANSKQTGRGSPTMMRSRSAHHIAQLRDNRLTLAPATEPSVPSSSRHWHRSRSTPHIDEVDRSYDSSTLSDDDSTPHVSRSNSRSKDCALANDLWDRTYASVDSRSDSASARSGGHTALRVGSMAPSRTGAVRPAETLSGVPGGFDHSLGRRQRQAGRSSVYALPEQVIREQTILSSRAKQLYAESLRLYNQQHGEADMVYASPVRAVNSCEEEPAAPPPLPPKQKSPLRRAPGRAMAEQSVGDGRTGERTVIQISDSGSVRARRPARRVSRREAETQTDSSLLGDELVLVDQPERARKPHVTLVSIDASSGRCPRSGDSADAWAAEAADCPARGEPGWSVSRLREMFAAGEPARPASASRRHAPLRRAAGDNYASPAELYSEEIYASPADLYASLPVSSRTLPLARTESADSSNDGEESYV